MIIKSIKKKRDIVKNIIKEPAYRFNANLDYEKWKLPPTWGFAILGQDVVIFIFSYMTAVVRAGLLWKKQINMYLFLSCYSASVVGVPAEHCYEKPWGKQFFFGNVLLIEYW